MTRAPKLTAIAAILAIAPLLAVGVEAQEFIKRTLLTFSGPVELPGVTLEPGTYELRLANPDSSRDVVQVRREHSNEVIGQFLFVQARRPRASGDTVVMFSEMPEGTTPAVQYWYYPGETIGREFIYPKDQAERIAAHTGQAVQSEDGPVTATAAAPPASGRPLAQADAPPAQSAPRQDAQLEPETPPEPPAIAEAAPEPAPQVAQAEPSPQPVGTSGVSQAPRQLPRTASPLALTALLGLLALAGAAGVRAIRR